VNGPVEPTDPPAVSVIMTALNESRHLAAAVQAVLDQDYSGPLELVVAVGPSDDDTWDIATKLAVENPRLTVVENPTGYTPAGLNVAIAHTDPSTTIIVRTDGHAELPPHYVSRAVATMLRSGADNVGGMMIPKGTAPLEIAVARAMSERIGLGGATFHVGGEEGPAPTVYLGVFRRAILERTGGFNEYYRRAQDWELNLRIRELGGVVWFDPELRVEYRPRGALRPLAKQFRGSGEWRWRIIRAHPETASVRYLAAPLAFAGIVAALLLLIVNAVAGGPAWLTWLGAAVPIAYLVIVFGGALLTRRGLGVGASAWYPFALITMHMSWGAGFIASALLGRGSRPSSD
jgi:glycosyltransferase involved in cell wall biosynthesis